MSTKRPDVIRQPPQPGLGLTLAHMHLQGWTLMGSCRCGLKLRISLPALIKVHGPDAILWGKTTPCPGWECDKRMEYCARSIVGGHFTNVSASPARKEQVDIWRAGREHQDLGPR